MKIIISPSKNQNRKNLIEAEAIKLLNYEKSLKLFSIFKNTSKTDLAKKMNLKGALLEETFALYQNFSINNAKSQAIDLYNGVVFEQINYQDFDDLGKAFLNEHLVILSAMYGVLQPFSYIWPYRLDFNAKFDNFNLYQYWKEDIDSFFKDEDIIINLASNEFSKLLNKYKEKFLNINFLERKEGRLRVVSYNAKKARGQMVRKIIAKQIVNIEEIKTLIIDDYKFDTKSSSPKEYNFVKAK